MYRLLAIWLLFYLFSASGEVGKKRSIRTQTATIMFVGDINFDGPVRHYVERGLSSYNTSFEYVEKYIRQADYATGNLESPFGTNKMRKNFSPKKTVYLLAQPESVEALKFAGIDAVTLGNNHVNDFGEEPVELTLRTLKSNRIDSFGINSGTPYARQVPLIKKIKEIKFGFLGYCSPDLTNMTTVRKKYQLGMSLYSEKVAKQDIEDLKSKVDVIVVYMHWGEEIELSPSGSTHKKAEFLRSLGVHIIIGAHPHVLHGHGYYGKSFLAYSIGNFIFGQKKTTFSKFQSLPGVLAEKNITKETFKVYEEEATRSFSPTKDTLILKVQVTKDGAVSASYLPCEIQFNVKTKSLQPVPRFENQWIDVCSEYDTLCLHNDKSNETS